MIVVSDLLENLDPQDRISPILAQYKLIAEDINFKQAVELFVETADTNEAKELSTFCRKFTVPLRQALKNKVGYKVSRMQSAVRFYIVFHSAKLLSM